MTGRIIASELPPGTELVAENDEPWIELIFDMVDPIVSGRKGAFGRDDRALACDALMQWEGSVYGFGLSFAPVRTWHEETRLEEFEGDDETEDESFELKLSWGRMELRSLGEPTLNLVRLMGDWIDLPQSSSFSGLLVAGAVVINDHVSNFETDALRTKLFLQSEGGEDDEPERYAELFVTVDLPNRLVGLCEKASEYREPLMRWLSGELGQPYSGWLQ